MNRPAAIFAALFVGLAPAVQAEAQAPASPRMVGAKIVDSKGKPVGQIERVIAGPGGQPVQVLVRVDRILRTLPANALSPAGEGYASVLSRAEIAALPPSE